MLAVFLPAAASAATAQGANRHKWLPGSDLVVVPVPAPATPADRHARPDWGQRHL